MIRGLLKLILVVILLVAAAAFFFGYSWGDGDGIVPDRPVGTSGVVDEVDESRARAVGAEVGETVAQGANEAQRVAADASVTAKIKAKMALDDQVRAATIDVDTNGSVVTLTGRVSSAAERTRAVQLARETEGVTRVVDQLQVQ